MSACPQCGRGIVQANLPGGSRITLDAEKVPGGEFAAWQTATRLSWVWTARPVDETDGWMGATAYQRHACEPAGQQLELDGAA